MARFQSFELFAVDLPFRRPFRHAAAHRTSSDSVMLKCTTSSGSAGFGECLPRPYVTGETRDGTFETLRDRILPRLIGMEFQSLDEVKSFLEECDGKAPRAWFSPAAPQMAAWAAVDLALLDAFGREFNEPVRLGTSSGLPPGLRFSSVVSAESGLGYLKYLIASRFLGFRETKLKVSAETPERAVRLARRFLGKRCRIHVDANMAWDVATAARAMRAFAREGIRLFEQPVRAADIEGLANLMRDTGLEVMVDESLTDGASLDALIARRACTAVNVRISKCGGLVASYRRCQRALEAGLTLKIGAQVGESSLLSAAQLILIAAVQRVPYAEGCVSKYLLREDPVQPRLELGRGGRPPNLPEGPGFGVKVNEEALDRYSVRKAKIGRE